MVCIPCDEVRKIGFIKIIRVHFLNRIEWKLHGIGMMANVSGVLELIQVSVLFRVEYSNGKFKQPTQARNTWLDASAQSILSYS